MAQPTNTARDRAGEALFSRRPRPLTSLPALAERGLVGADNLTELDSVTRQFSVAVTADLAALIDPHDPQDPIALQFIPDPRELEQHALDISDPIGDATHSPVTGIVHRYPDRVLLLPVRVCAVYCRFCFRRETVGPNEAAGLTRAELSAALDYIRRHEEIWEVILSGGDPLLLSPRRLQDIMAALDEIDHVRVVRIHTRLPVADPGRVSQSLINSLASEKTVYLLLHTNHPRELTPEVLASCARLAAAGITLLSQTVLLKGVNDDARTLEVLFRKLVEHQIKPYYLHHCDRAPGTAHFRTTLAEGQAIMRQLRGRLSGLCLPEYVLDIPGGNGKVPVGPEWLDSSGAVLDYLGARHTYPE